MKHVSKSTKIHDDLPRIPEKSEVKAAAAAAEAEARAERQAVEDAKQAEIDAAEAKRIKGLKAEDAVDAISKGLKPEVAEALKGIDKRKAIKEALEG